MRSTTTVPMQATQKPRRCTHPDALTNLEAVTIKLQTPAVLACAWLVGHLQAEKMQLGLNLHGVYKRPPGVSHAPSTVSTLCMYVVTVLMVTVMPMHCIGRNLMGLIRPCSCEHETELVDLQNEGRIRRFASCSVACCGRLTATPLLKG